MSSIICAWKEQYPLEQQYSELFITLSTQPCYCSGIFNVSGLTQGTEQEGFPEYEMKGAILACYTITPVSMQHHKLLHDWVVLKKAGRARPTATLT